MEASRFGKGAISLPVTMELDASSQRATATAIAGAMANLKAEAKVKVGVDYDENAIARMAARDAGALRRSANRGAYLESMAERGMLPSLVSAGLVKENELRMIGYQGTATASPIRPSSAAMAVGMRGNGVSSARDVAEEQSVRNEMAAEIRRMRASSQKARAGDEARRRLFGEDGSSVLDELADAAKGTRSRKSSGGLSDLFTTAGAIKAGLAGLVAGAGFQTVMAGASYSTASSLAGYGAASGNNRAAIAGQMGQLEAIQSVPIVGQLAKLFDELGGMTRSFRARLLADSQQQAMKVESAALSRSPINLMAAQQGQRLYDMKAEYAQQGVFIQEGSDAQRGNYLTVTGKSAEANAAAGEAYARRKQLDAEQMAWERTKLRVGQRRMQRSEDSINSQTAYRPMEAAQIDLHAQFEEDYALAAPEMQQRLKTRYLAQRALLARQQARAVQQDQYATDTAGAAAQMRVNNQGMRLEDEDTLVRLRGLANDVTLAPEEGGYKERARFRAMAEARAMKASLEVRGGGFAQETNLANTMIGDQLGLDPQTRSRGRARKMIDDFLAGKGTVTTQQFSAATNTWQEKQSTLTERMVSLLESVVDKLGGKALLGN